MYQPIYTTATVGSVGVEPTPADFQSAASTELAYFPRNYSDLARKQSLPSYFLLK